jgi:hypothetical protein
MDDFARAIAAAAGWQSDELSAVYFEREESGLAGLAEADAALALVTLPFFLEHRSKAALDPRLLAVPDGLEAIEPWTLVAGRDAIGSPEDLRGWSLVSLAGHSPRFVRAVLAGWGELPDSVRIEFSSSVLTSLRRAAKGESIALLLDAQQAAAVDRLPFAGDLEIVHTSDAVPVSVLCAVAGRLGDARLAEVVTTLEQLDGIAAAAEAMAGVRILRFEPVNSDAMTAIERAFAEAAE